MASPNAHSASRLAFIFLLLTVVFLARQLLPTTLHTTPPHAKILIPPEVELGEIRIEGRWKAVRSSLGLPPLRDTIKLPATPAGIFNRKVLRLESRFDLNRKRSAEPPAAEELAQLYFAPDALNDPVVTYEELLVSFHAMALLEKEAAGEAGRARASKQGQGQGNQRRASSWTTREKMNKQ